jgi:hypothetical protein
LIFRICNDYAIKIIDLFYVNMALGNNTCRSGHLILKSISARCNIHYFPKIYPPAPPERDK